MKLKSRSKRQWRALHARRTEQVLMDDACCVKGVYQPMTIVEIANGYERRYPMITMLGLRELLKDLLRKGIVVETTYKVKVNPVLADIQKPEDVAYTLSTSWVTSEGRKVRGGRERILAILEAAKPNHLHLNDIRAAYATRFGKQGYRHISKRITEMVLAEDIDKVMSQRGYYGVHNPNTAKPAEGSGTLGLAPASQNNDAAMLIRLTSTTLNKLRAQAAEAGVPVEQLVASRLLLQTIVRKAARRARS